MWISYYNNASGSSAYSFTLLPKGTDPTYINKTYTPNVNETVSVLNDYEDAYYMQKDGSSTLTPITTYCSDKFEKTIKTIWDKYENILGYATFIVKPADASLTVSDNMTRNLSEYQLKDLNQTDSGYLTVTLDGVDVKNSSYVTYSSSNPDVVSVNGNGTLSYNGFGDAIVTATFQDDDLTDGRPITGSCAFSFRQTCASIDIENGNT